MVPQGNGVPVPSIRSILVSLGLKTGLESTRQANGPITTRNPGLNTTISKDPSASNPKRCSRGHDALKGNNKDESRMSKISRILIAPDLVEGENSYSTQVRKEILGFNRGH